MFRFSFSYQVLFFAYGAHAHIGSRAPPAFLSTFLCVKHACIVLSYPFGQECSSGVRNDLQDYIRAFETEVWTEQDRVTTHVEIFREYIEHTAMVWLVPIVLRATNSSIK